MAFVAPLISSIGAGISSAIGSIGGLAAGAGGLSGIGQAVSLFSQVAGMFSGGAPDMPPPLPPREYQYPQNLEQPAAIEPAAQVGVSNQEDAQKRRALLAQKTAAKSVLASSKDTTETANKASKISLLGG